MQGDRRRRGCVHVDEASALAREGQAVGAFWSADGGVRLAMGARAQFLLKTAWFWVSDAVGLQRAFRRPILQNRCALHARFARAAPA